MWNIGTVAISVFLATISRAALAEPGVTIFLTGETTIKDCQQSGSAMLPEEESDNHLTENANSNAQTIGPVSCPDSRGYYQSPSSQQCFRFYRGRYRWQEAKDKCASEGMVMAQPEDRSVEELNQYLNEIFGYGVWLGARGYGSNFLWEGTNTVVSSSYWADGEPKYLRNYYCLAIVIGSVPYYYSRPCLDNYRSTLCEVINE